MTGNPSGAPLSSYATSSTAVRTLAGIAMLSPHLPLVRAQRPTKRESLQKPGEARARNPESGGKPVVAARRLPVHGRAGIATQSADRGRRVPDPHDARRVSRQRGLRGGGGREQRGGPRDPR